MRGKIFCFAIFLLFSTSTLHARSEFILPQEIHEGMVGYGLTVFHGTQVEQFKVVVLGVLKKALADSDMILVRIESPFLSKKRIGLVAGMSGSPVYFNGRLAGAIAYGWPFTPEPVAGITPIKSMLKSTQETKSQGGAMGYPQHLLDSVNVQLGKNQREIFLQPLPIPISASGFDSAELNQLQNIFPMLKAVPGGGKMSNPLKGGTSLIAGQSVGAALMEGDMSLTATGTVTYRHGKKILAFGHPFLFLGDVDLPLYQSYVHYVLPSIQLPTKFASTLQEVGRISQDRLFGVSGSIGKHAVMVPMDITIYDKEKNYSHAFHIKIMRHPDFTPRLAAMAIEQAIQSTSKLLGSATAYLESQLDFENHPSIRFKNAVFSDQSISTLTSTEVVKPMLRVLGNDFERVNLQKISVHVSIIPKLAAATIQRVVLSKHHLLPGEPFSLTVFLKPYNERIIQKTFEMHLPSDVQGTVQVGVAGGGFEEQLRKLMSAPLPEPLNVDQIVEQIQGAPSNDSLIVRLTFPRRSINWAGEELGNLPQPYAELLKAAGTNPIVFHADGSESRHPMPWVILGSEMDELTVAGKPSTPSAEKIPSPSSFPLPSLPPSLEEPLPPTPPSSATSLPEPSPSPSFSLPPLFPPLSEGEESKSSSQTFGSLQDWQEGTLHDLSISPNGDLTLGPTVAKLASFEENVLWAQARSGDLLYVGTGNPGKIYLVNQEHASQLFFDPHAIAVLSLAGLPQGELLAGVTGGKLFWLDSAGKIKRQWTLPEYYIWHILSAGKVVYLATGSPGKIYKLTLDNQNSEPSVLYTSSQSHILCLHLLSTGTLYAGTANIGLLLEIQPDGSSKTLYDLDEQAILSLASDSQGNLYIGTSGKGKIYRYKPESGIVKLAELPDKDITWLGIQGNKVLATTGIPARLYAVNPDGKLSLLWDGKPNEQVALQGNSDGNHFHVSGNSAALLQITSSPVNNGEFLSKIMDTEAKSTWGRLDWHGTLPSDSQLLVRTRTGNSAVPDRTWSSWSLPYPIDSNTTIESPSGRYIQVKASLSKNSSGQTPSLEAVHFAWRGENLPPSVSVSSPLSGDVIGPKSTLHGKVKDEDGDTVKVELWIQAISSKSKKDWERIYSHLYPISKSKGEESFSIPLNSIHHEGLMKLKVIVTDAPSNGPDKGLSNEIILKDLIYDSTGPKLTITKSKVQKDSLHLEGIAEDNTSYIKAVQFRMNGGAWLDTVPTHRLFDSQNAPFFFDLDDLTDVKQIEIRALDGADNEIIVKKNLKDL